MRIASKCAEIPCARNEAVHSRRADARRVSPALRRGQGLRPFPRTPFSACGIVPALRSGGFFLTKPNTSRTIEVPASLRSENCSPSARNAVRVPSGISVRLRRNPQFVKGSHEASLVADQTHVVELAVTLMNSSVGLPDAVRGDNE